MGGAFAQQPATAVAVHVLGLMSISLLSLCTSRDFKPTTTKMDEASGLCVPATADLLLAQEAFRGWEHPGAAHAGDVWPLPPAARLLLS